MRAAIVCGTAFLLVLMGLTFLSEPAEAHTEDDPQTIDLLAGQNIDVGDVLVWNDGDYLYVKYVVHDPTPEDVRDNWYITETHLQAFLDDVGFTDVPLTKKGNAIPGQFEYANEHDYVTEFTYEIELEWDYDTEIFIAAHAVVEMLGGLEGLEAALPDQVSMKVMHPGTGYGDASYFDVTIGGGTILDGQYDDWCIDTDNVIYSNTWYTADVYSSYGDIPAGLLEYPENLDLINYILNQDWVGQMSAGGWGIYTYGDVQRAIWSLIEDGQSPSGLGSWSQYRVDEILADAIANGEGFVPGCGDTVGIILDPVGEVQITIAQVTLAEVGVPCYTVDETAWGEGEGFPGNDWSMYFGYTVQDFVCPVIFDTSGQTIMGQTLMSQLAAWDLPDTVKVKVTYPYTGGPSYFPHLYIDADMDGDWDYDVLGWCVDVQHTINQNQWYTATVYTCGDVVPVGVVDKPANIPYVSHILAQDWVGKDAGGTLGAFTYGDVQRAIWNFIDDQQSTNGIGPWNGNRVNIIIADALASV